MKTTTTLVYLREADEEDETNYAPEVHGDC